MTETKIGMTIEESSEYKQSIGLLWNRQKHHAETGGVEQAACPSCRKKSYYPQGYLGAFHGCQ